MSKTSSDDAPREDIDSNEEGSIAVEVEPPRKRFKIVAEEDKNKWSFSESMLNYVQDCFESYTAEKDIKEQINPRPENLKPVRKLDGAVAR